MMEEAACRAGLKPPPKRSKRKVFSQTEGIGKKKPAKLSAKATVVSCERVIHDKKNNQKDAVVFNANQNSSMHCCH